jgi:hypothetical protein
MRGAIPPFPNTPSWLGAQLKNSTGTTLTFSKTCVLYVGGEKDKTEQTES